MPKFQKQFSSAGEIINYICRKKTDGLFSFVFLVYKEMVEGIESYFNRCPKRQEYPDFSVFMRIVFKLYHQNRKSRKVLALQYFSVLTGMEQQQLKFYKCLKLRRENLIKWGWLPSRPSRRLMINVFDKLKYDSLPKR